MANTDIDKTAWFTAMNSSDIANAIQGTAALPAGITAAEVIQDILQAYRTVQEDYNTNTADGTTNPYINTVAAPIISQTATNEANNMLSKTHTYTCVFKEIFNSGGYDPVNQGTAP